MSHTTEEPHVTVYTEQIKTPTFIHIDDAQSSVFHNLCDTFQLFRQHRTKKHLARQVLREDDETYGDFDGPLPICKTPTQ